MASQDLRLAKWDLKCSAGITQTIVFTKTPAAAITSLSVFVGGTVSDVDDTTGATEAVATISGSSSEIATVSFAVPTSRNTTPLRLEVDGVIRTVGVLQPSNSGAAVAATTGLTLATDGASFALTVAPGAVQTAAQILTAIKTVDGAGSGLDADLVDGNEASALLARANHTGTQAQSTVTDLVSDLAAKEATLNAAGVVGKFTGTPDGTQFLKDDGTLAAPTGGPFINAAAAPYSATGNGSTDDRAAIQAALDAASAAGGGVVFLPAGTYLIKRPLWMASKVTLKGAGRGATTITKPSTVKSLLTANASALATSVTVTSATGFEVGGPIHLSDTTSFEWLSTQGTITNIAGNVITFTNAEGLGRTGLDGLLQTSRSATAYTSFPLIRNVLASSRVCVRDLTLNGNQSANDPAPGTNLSGVQNTTDFTIAPIHWVENYYYLVENVEILNAAGDAISDQAQDLTGVTPAANLIKKIRGTIRGCRIDGSSRHGVHIGSCHDGATVEGNEIVNCGWYGYFYCAYATYGTARGNIVDTCGSGFAGGDDRDVGNVIADNVISNCSVAGVDFNNGSAGGTLPVQLSITGNSITTPSSSGGIRVSVPDATIANNTIVMLTGATGGIAVTATGDRAMIANNIVQQATAASGSKGIEVNGADDVHLVGNTLKGMQNGINVQGCLRLVGQSNAIASTTARTWWFNGTASTDCLIDGHRSDLSTITEDTAPTRLVVNGLGTNGSTDPASGGSWNSVSGARWNGTMVRWNSGGGEKVSIFYSGVGWTALN